MRVGRPLPQEDLEYILREATDLWPDLKGARLLVTGATGFFGRWLLESLLLANRQAGLGASIVALSRTPEAFLEGTPHLAGPEIAWIKGSVSTLEAGTLRGGKFDMVVHLATEADTQADPSAAAAVIVDGTRRVLEAAAAAGATRLLFTSSGAVYGSQPPDMERVPEDYSGVPGRARKGARYAVGGEAKRQAEMLCTEASGGEGLGVVIARGFAFAGPGMPVDGKFAFGNFIRDAVRGGPIVIRGDGTPLRSYLYAADLAVWLWTLLLRGKPGRAYNVGSENPVSMLQLAEAVSHELGSRGIEVLRQPAEGGAPDRYLPSTQRARDELGLREKFGLPEIIRRTAAWHRSSLKR